MANEALAGANPAGTSQPRKHLAEPGAVADSPRPMPGPKKKPTRDRKTLTVRLPVDVIARLKRVARMAAGHPCYATVTSICESGIEKQLDLIERRMKDVFNTPVLDESDDDPAVTELPAHRHRLSIAVNNRIPQTTR